MRKILFTFIAICSLSAETTQHLWNDCLPYQAKTGTIELLGEKEEVTGRIFYTAYTKEFVDSSQRPITFCFNGGPGSSSIWLHMGAFGPKRVVTLKEKATIAPPYQWIENKDSLIDVTDLVFIDPIGTGFSRHEKEQDPNQFWGVQEDLQSICNFIATYLTENKRWSSPKYLAGESYGSTRCAGLAETLQIQHGIYLNGMILISSAVDFKTLFNPESPLPQMMTLPSFAATAWHHQRLPNLSLEEAIQKSKDFAYGPYATALLLGKENELSICKELSYFTGLPLEFIQRNQGRISILDFTEEFFGNERKVLGLYDTSMVGDKLPQSCNIFSDPSLAFITGIYTATWNSYLQKELSHTATIPYQVFCEKANMQWKFPAGESLDLTPALRSGMVSNPELKIFVAGGHFDLITPFAAAEYMLSQLRIPVKDRVFSGFYKGGHMFYLHPESLHQFHEDLVQFYKQSKNLNEADSKPKQELLVFPIQAPQINEPKEEPVAALANSTTDTLVSSELEEPNFLESPEWETPFQEETDLQDQDNFSEIE